MRYIKAIRADGFETDTDGLTFDSSSHIGAETQFGLKLNEVSQFPVLYCCIRKQTNVLIEPS